MLREMFGNCSVHKCKLLPEDVPIRYGLIRSPADLLSAKKQFFPNAYSFVLGGCLVSPQNPKTRKVFYCAECRTAEAAWHQANPKSYLTTIYRGKCETL